VSTDLIRFMHDPAAATALGARLATVMSDYWRAAQTDGFVLPPIMRDRAEMLRVATAALEQAPASASAAEDRFVALARTFMEQSHRLHAPQDSGHQVAPAVPWAALMEGVVSASSQGVAVYEMGPFARAAELAVIRKLCGFIGYDARASGIATGGGSLANLTALLAARNRALPHAWQRGLGTAPSPVLVMSSDSHYSVARAAGVLGLGTDSIIKIPVDGARRMRPDALASALDRARAEGRTVIAVVASACATPIGAFDPLPEIAAITRLRGIWLHVDAAHGGGLLVSPDLRGRLAGIDQADSVIWDAHKMLHMPALLTFLLYRDGKDRFHAFAQDAPYVFGDGETPDQAEWDAGLATAECTRKGHTVALWAFWSTFGTAATAAIVDHLVATTHAFYDDMRASPDFVPVHEPECNILCFRHIPEALRSVSPEVLSRHQQTLYQKLVADGRHFLSATMLDGEWVLRVTVMNPLTTCTHLQALLSRSRELASAKQRGRTVALACGTDDSVQRV
jgi:L-2,4-diaminobutyrate decarboxylase